MNLQNLVDYCQGAGLPDPFAGVSVPTPLNRDTCISAIMVRCGLLTPVFNDPDTFRNATAEWFLEKTWVFQHLINIIYAEYSPIENVDRHEQTITTYGKTETRSGGYKDTEGGKDTTALSGTDQRDISNTGTDTTTNEISAFNSTGYQADNKSSLLHGHAVDDDITYGKQSDLTYGHTNEREYKNDKNTAGGKDTTTVHVHGNIGVTSNQQLINQELDLLQRFDVYKFIAQQFENDLHSKIERVRAS